MIALVVVLAVVCAGFAIAIGVFLRPQDTTVDLPTVAWHPETAPGPALTGRHRADLFQPTKPIRRSALLAALKGDPR